MAIDKALLTTHSEDEGKSVKRLFDKGIKQTSKIVQAVSLAPNAWRIRSRRPSVSMWSMSWDCTPTGRLSSWMKFSSATAVKGSDRNGDVDGHAP